jgi:hypothetical protein
MGKKILMLVGDFGEDYEIMVPFRRSRRWAHRARGLSGGRRRGRRSGPRCTTFEGDQTYSEKRGHDFTLNATYAEVKPHDYDALVFPGGRAPGYLGLDRTVLATVRHFAETGSPSRSLPRPRRCWPRRRSSGAGSLGVPGLRAEVRSPVASTSTCPWTGGGGRNVW